MITVMRGSVILRVKRLTRRPTSTSNVGNVLLFSHQRSLSELMSSETIKSTRKRGAAAVARTKVLQTPSVAANGAMLPPSTGVRRSTRKRMPTGRVARWL